MFDFDDDDGMMYEDAGDAGVDGGGFEYAELVGAGTAYALYRHGQDRQAEQIISALRQQQKRDPDDINVEVDVRVHDDDQTTTASPVMVADYSGLEDTASWKDYIGQDPLKRQLLTYISSAQKRNRPLPHVLLASGRAGVGKTKMARLIAQTMGVKIVELMPPFNIYTLAEAALQLGDRGILFIDEIHKLAEHGKRGAEILLKVLEEKVAYLPDGTVQVLNDITVIGATTDRDMLPETVIDRFKIKPYFQAYTEDELMDITLNFADQHGCLDQVSDQVVAAISMACKGTPRLCEEFVLACQAMADMLGRPPEWRELLEFLEVELDGMTRVDIQYVTSLYQFYARRKKDGTIEYVAGEAAMQNLLRETKNGLARIERYLMEQGLVDRTPQGRRLTPKGVEAAQDYIARGKGSSHVA